MKDANLTFCTATSVAASASSTPVLIGSQINLRANGLNPGAGLPIYLVIVTTTEIITGGAAGTIQFILASDDSATVHATTSTYHMLTPKLATDDAAANSAKLNANGVIYKGAIPIDTYEQYIGLLCLTETTTTTAGAITAFLTTDPNAWKAYSDAVDF